MRRTSPRETRKHPLARPGGDTRVPHAASLWRRGCRATTVSPSCDSEARGMGGAAPSVSAAREPLKIRALEISFGLAAVLSVFACAKPDGSVSSTSDAWFEAGAAQDLRLTWTVYPVLAAGESGAKRKLELVLRVGEAVRRVPLGVQTGDLLPGDQSVCNAALKSGETVSQLGYQTVGMRESRMQSRTFGMRPTSCRSIAGKGALRVPRALST